MDIPLLPPHLSPVLVIIVESEICGPQEFLCKKNQRCITKDWLCDGDNDCGDHSDENLPRCNGIYIDYSALSVPNKHVVIHRI